MELGMEKQNDPLLNKTYEDEDKDEGVDGEQPALSRKQTLVN